jgi:DnaJ-class molecular chaperone
MAQDRSRTPSGDSPKNPGDEVAPGTPQTGETICPDCRGTGRLNGGPCAACGGSGRVVQQIGDA